MYLSELEIVGFKSFANKTKFKFQGGITALVGPNGCGKTNIVDAIRWVLGEQKSSVLRSDVMENVIFNGNATRKPLGLAEVTMTIENTRGILPTEYSQVNIARRLYRSGDSAYLLNKTKCRLRDVHDLFMDTGMGSDSYSVIELKMVEAILSGKAEERRHLFEEAAGVTKYKQRRKEASSKLKKVQLDLERINDIVVEIEKNVSSLSRQAQRTRRYNQLLSELKEVEISLINHEYFILSSKKEEISNLLEKLNEKIALLEKQFEEMHNHQLLLKENFAGIESRYNTSIENERRSDHKVSEIKQEIAVSSEKREALLITKERLEKEISEADGIQKRLMDNLQTTFQKLEETKSKIENAEINLDEKISARNEAQKLVAEIREDVNSISRSLTEIQSEINTHKSLKDRNSTKKTQLEDRIENNQNQIQKLQNEIEAFSSTFAKLEERRLSISQKIEESESELRKSQESKQVLENKLSELRHNLSDKKNQLSSKKASRDYLKSLADNDDNAKFLINAKSWNTSNDKSVLAELVGADEEYRIAVNSALGAAGHFIVVESKEEAYTAFDLLKSNGKGKFTFISRDLIKNTDAPKIDLPQNAIAWLSEAVRVDDRLRHFLRNLLGTTCLANSYEEALKIINSSEVDCVVTLAGEIVAKDGRLKGGGKLKDEAAVIGKKERILAVEDEIAQLEELISNLNNEASEIQEELKEIDIPSMQRELKNYEQQQRETEQKISQSELKRDSLEQNIQVIENSNARFAEEIAEISLELVQLEQKFDDANSELSKAKEEYAAVQTELSKAENNAKSLVENARIAEIEYVQIKSEANSLQKESERLEQQIQNDERKAELRQNELSTNLAIAQSLTLKIDELKEMLIKAQEEYTSSRLVRNQLEDEKKDIQEQLENSERDLENLRLEVSKSKDEHHRLDISNSEITTKLETIDQKASDEYQLTIDLSNFTPDEEYNLQNAKNQVSDLKSKLSQLGSVNFMAIEEFEEQSERLNFYTQQVADLQSAEKTLNETIDEINDTAQKNFTETFVKIKENFKYLFTKLFNDEGFCDITMKEGDPLEADIEITAKPPGKKPHSIEMLSGGEKTLTAISLLFAIYMVKPSPFCILDEVDAPLDDANIGRFVLLIREFSEKTQFLIVTHNKKTMEAADTLYGITQQETGVSKIVSVRLNNETKKEAS